ncbi:MAG TPA: right-handed parallel beta-helix repeat-containing protein [Rudaea sp.]|nr:right-handed parallel beta-helix repeat-containing protein [Rudaea sp.]
MSHTSFRSVPACPSRGGRALALVRTALCAIVLGTAATRAGATTVKTYCVGDSSQLADVLSSGNETASVDLDIRIRQGTYTIGTTSYSFIAPTTLRGGWSDVDCTQRNPNPYNTVIDLSGGALDLEQPKGPSRAALTIDGLTFRHGTTVNLGAGTVNLYFNDDGDLTVRRTRFTGLTGGAEFLDTIGLWVATGNGLIENVLIDHIGTAAYGCAVGLNVDGSSAGFGVNYVTGDFAGSVCLATGPEDYVSNYFDIANSIFWHSAPGLPSIVSQWNNHNSNFNLQIRSTLVHSVYDQNNNLAAFTEQVDADPKWIAPASGSYDLGPGSPALDMAYPDVNLGLPSNDMIGQARYIGPYPDLGALESNGSTVPTYIVSNTADSGAGSLRQAVLDANASIDQGDIIFQLPGGCPQVIGLNSPLPDVTSPIRILGYSQAGAAPNQDAERFEPTLCVLVKPASGALTYALRVPASANAGQLDVSGVGFGGFGQAVVLLGGSPHRVTGNQFGGITGGVYLPGSTVNAITVGLGSIGSVQIGGPTPGERNMISGAASGSGVDIQSSVNMDPDRCRIVNNLIGTNQSALAAIPNGWGINLAGSGCAVIGNRIAGNYYDGIWINGGDNNLVQRNLIGLGADDSGPLAVQNAWGIRISGSNNVIGSPYAASALGGTVNANEIAYMLKGGIVVQGSGSYNDAMRGNLIHDIGAGGNALAIDLGGDGATANDSTDTDSGANYLQNYPTITALKYPTAYPAADAQNVAAYFFGELDGTAPGLYRVDAYFYNGGCAAGQRGKAAVYLGSYPALIGAGGTKSVFNYLLQLPNVAADAAIGLTATDQDGNTSEIGACFPVSHAMLLDDIFKDGYEG